MYKEKNAWHITNIADLEAVQIMWTQFINEILKKRKKVASNGRNVLESTTQNLNY